MSTAAPYPFVHVDADGTARELHDRERRYLETEFKGGDGAAPYIKSSYEERNGWGDLSGYLQRAPLPDGTAVAAAPAQDPNPPMSREEFIAWLRRKGVAVTDDGDAARTVSKPETERS
jgi:hypothetical protein